MVESWGRFLAHRARTVLVAGVLGVIAAAAFGIGVFPALSNGGFDDPGSESARSWPLSKTSFGGHEQDVVAMYSSNDMVATDPAFERSVKAVVAGPARRRRRAGRDVLRRRQPGAGERRTSTPAWSS